MIVTFVLMSSAPTIAFPNCVWWTRRSVTSSQKELLEKFASESKETDEKARSSLFSDTIDRIKRYVSNS